MSHRHGRITLFLLITLGLPRFLDRPPLEILVSFTERHDKLKNVLLPAASSVALTSDIRFGNTKEDYISVVAHYMNAD